MELADQWRYTLSRQKDFIGGHGKGGYPLDHNFAAITLPLFVAHVTNVFLGATDPLAYVLPKRVQTWLLRAAGWLVPLSFAAIFFDLMGTTNGTARGWKEDQPSIRQWIDWWEINWGLNFAMADILYELLFSTVFVLVARYYANRGRSSVVVALVMFCYIKWTNLLSYTKLGLGVYSPLEFWTNLTTVWNPRQGGGADGGIYYE